MNRRNSIDFKVLTAMTIAGIVLFVLNLLVGSVTIPLTDIWNAFFHPDSIADSTRTIVIEYRLPQAITAILAGGALSVAGLLMQTLFRNPMADPSILGISSGAGFGVAVVFLISGAIAGTQLTMFKLWSTVGISVSAFAGALLVLTLMMSISSRFTSKVSLILVGLMVAYFTGSVTDILKFFSRKEDIHLFVVWGLGSFANVGLDKIWFVAGSIVIGVIPCLFLSKTLNLMLLGDRYAENLGLNIKRSNTVIIFLSGYLTAIVTAFCGPIAFLGLAVPHLARLLFRTSDHNTLIPATILTGSALALLCNFISRLPVFESGLPINAITAMIGAPTVIWIILYRQKNFR